VLGASALLSNTTGNYNVATGMYALAANTTGFNNTADGVESLLSNTTGSANTATGLWALLSNSTGSLNTGVGFRAGAEATTGSSNIFVGADVAGTATDTNTIRIGLPYGSLGAGTGQNQTFIAGIYGTQLSGNVLQVFVDANGKLGTLNPPQVLRGTGTISVSALQQQLAVQQARSRDQDAVIADLTARLARVEALLQSVAHRK
jgi:hypothetical protein